MKKLLGIAGFTIVEVAGLVVWLILALQGQGLLGLGILFVALTGEHLITDVVIGRTSGLPILPILAFSGIETAIWGIWLLIAQGVNPYVAAVFLAVSLLVEHTLSDNVFRGQPLFSRIVELRTAGFTVIEVVAATVWLILVLQGQPIVGAVVMLIGSFIEHNVAVRVAAR